jgi:hypothetical protein
MIRDLMAHGVALDSGEEVTAGVVASDSINLPISIATSSQLRSSRSCRVGQQDHVLEGWVLELQEVAAVVQSARRSIEGSWRVARSNSTQYVTRAATHRPYAPRRGSTIGGRRWLAFGTNTMCGHGRGVAR